MEKTIPQLPKFLHKSPVLKPRLRIVKRSQDSSTGINCPKFSREFRRLTESSSHTSNRSALLSPKLSGVQQTTKACGPNISQHVELVNTPRVSSASPSHSTRQQSAQQSLCYLRRRPFQRVECSTDFFKPGGLVPGSSNVNRPRHISRLMAPQAILSYEATNPPRLKWTIRTRLERLQADCQAVEALDCWNPAGCIEEPAEDNPPEIPQGTNSQGKLEPEWLVANTE